MLRKEFEQLTNEKQLKHLNNYIGDTARFSQENDFSWSTATKLANAVKIDGQYVLNTNAKITENIKQKENIYETLFYLQRNNKVKCSVNLNDEVVEMLNNKVNETNWTKTEIINYCLYKGLKDFNFNEK